MTVSVGGCLSTSVHVCFATDSAESEHRFQELENSQRVAQDREADAQIRNLKAHLELLEDARDRLFASINHITGQV